MRIAKLRNAKLGNREIANSGRPSANSKNFEIPDSSSATRNSKSEIRNSQVPIRNSQFAIQLRLHEIRNSQFAILILALL